MAKEPKELKFSQQYAVMEPEQEGFVPVPLSVWKQYMARLKRCTVSTSTLESASWACFGCAVSLLATTVTFFFSAEYFDADKNPRWPIVIAEMLFFVLSIGFGIAWWGFWQFAKSQKQFHTEMVQIILEDMKLLGDKYLPSEETKAIRDEVMAAAGLKESKPEG